MEWSCWLYHSNSQQTSMVFEETQTSLSFTKRPCVLLLWPVLEYASPVWHSSLTAEQRQTIETVQWLACQIIVGSGTYVDNCTRLGLENLAERRHCQARITQSTVFHSLIPAKRDETVTSRLRTADQLPRLFAKTNRFRNSCFFLTS